MVLLKILLLVNFLCNYGLMQYYESLGWLSYNRIITSWHILKFKCSRKHVEKGSVLVKTVLDLSPPSQKCAKSKPLYQVFILAKNVWVGLDYPSWSDKFDILLMHALSEKKYLTGKIISNLYKENFVIPIIRYLNTFMGGGWYRAGVNY